MQYLWAKFPWANCSLGELSVDELSVGRIVHWANCPLGEFSVGWIVRWVNCPWGELSVGKLSMGMWVNSPVTVLAVANLLGKFSAAHIMAWQFKSVNGFTSKTFCVLYWRFCFYRYMRWRSGEVYANWKCMQIESICKLKVGNSLEIL